ncbi:MAG: Rpn family recombination-promoting nuclease/putative transposase [Bacteroidales bacterium]|nr:Rpn family recombination-promoting nuclease/putative transposase [Bacteroidales bacterium]
MSQNQLTKEQQQQFMELLNEYEKYRNLSKEEKENLVVQITSTTYIDLLCDWAFKHCFGHNKENLMLLLNDFIPEEIIDIEYDPNETDLFRGCDKQVIMDVICHTKDRQFIVEMQKCGSNEFRNRMLYYGASSITRQLNSGEGYDKLVPVYVICFMNFFLIHDTDQLVYRYQIREQDSGELYGQQLNIIFCELPRWVKPLSEAKTPIEEWFDILQNMSNFAEKPASISKRYDSIFAACQRGRLKGKELEQYFRAMITEREEKGIAAFYKEEGLREGFDLGKAEGKAEVAARLLAKGVDPNLIMEATGLTPEEIQKLKK